jgi:starvation-inducible DNA-binding protein
MPKTSKTTPIAALDHLLAAFTITAQNARFCHWNVTGPLFEDNHEFFGDLYEYLAEAIDLFAERIRALGSYPTSSLAAYLRITKIKEYALPMNAAHMQKHMLADLIHISAEMSEFAARIDDLVTQDIIISELREIEKKAWMLRAMLSK